MRYFSFLTSKSSIIIITIIIIIFIYIKQYYCLQIICVRLEYLYIIVSKQMIVIR